MAAAMHLSVRAANLLFGACFLMVTVTTLVALGAVGSMQAMCKNDSLAEFWTVPYQMFLAQSAPVKPWTCKWWIIIEWWTLGLQMLFWLSVTLAWATGFLERHLPALVGSGGVASALSVATCLFIMGEGWYYTGRIYDLGLIAFWGFFFICLFNGFLVVAACELNHAKRQEAAARAQLNPQSESASDGTSGAALDKAAASV